MEYTFSYYYMLLFIVHVVSVESIVQCYNISDYEHCFSTNKDVKKIWSEAKAECEKNNSRLLSITNNDIQSISQVFRTESGVYSNTGIWIDVYTTIADGFHWINGPTGSLTVDNQDDTPVTRRFAVIIIINNQLSYYAQTFDTLSFHICQYSGGVCESSDFTKNSLCYKKYNSEQVTWFTASNRCLSMNGSLATFNDLSTPNSENDLKVWLNTTNSTRYWLGLVRGWFMTTALDGSTADVQYTNWQSGPPSKIVDNSKRCILVASSSNSWLDYNNCNDPQPFVCQAVRPLFTTTLTRSTSSVIVSSTSTVSSRSLTIKVASVTGSYSNYGSTTSKITSNNTASIIIGVIVGVGVPVIIAIVVVVAFVVFRRRRSRSPIVSSKEPADIDRLTSTDDSITKPQTSSPQQDRQQPERDDIEGASYAVVERAEKQPETGPENNNEPIIYADVVRVQANTFENNAYENQDVGGPNGGHVIYADLVNTSAPTSPFQSET